MMIYVLRNLVLVLMLNILFAVFLRAQGDQELAKKTQNPVSDLISVPFQNNTSFGIGYYDRTQNVLNIQPVIPLSAGSVNIITRAITPIIYQPDAMAADGGTFGLGDINATFFISPAKPSKFIWGAGPAIVIPTATDRALGTGKLGLGPSFVGLTTSGPWVVGGLVSNVWSVAGDADRSDLNQFLFQYFINYNLPGGWYISSAPILTSNWEAEDGSKWVVPFGGGMGKIFRVGRQPMNAGAQVFYNVEKPEGGPDWGLRLQLQLLFPK